MDVRPITEDELATFSGTFMRNMGFGPPSDATLERDRKNFLYDRSLAAFDDGLIVGTAHSHLFHVTLPGGATVPSAGVTAISVSPTHRRRGIITDLKRRQLREARDREEPSAILVASEGRIYRRFGYGVATQVTDIKLVVNDGRIEHRGATGRIREVFGDEIDELFPKIHDAIAATRPGGIVRPAHFWVSAAAERDAKTHHVVHENASGEPDGFARYDVKGDWNEGLPAHKGTVHDLTGIDDAAMSELWTFVLSTDLVREWSAWGRPVDEPLRWMFDEPRTVRTQTLRDQYWFRPLDVANVLAARTYAIDVDLKIEVADPLLDFGGTFHLQGGTDGATCSPAKKSGADLRMGISELGSLMLGGITPVELARVGRIVELASGAVAKANLAFPVAPKPWGDVYF